MSLSKDGGVTSTVIGSKRRGTKKAKNKEQLYGHRVNVSNSNWFGTNLTSAVDQRTALTLKPCSFFFFSLSGAFSTNAVIKCFH